MSKCSWWKGGHCWHYKTYTMEERKCKNGFPTRGRLRYDHYECCKCKRIKRKLDKNHWWN